MAQLASQQELQRDGIAVEAPAAQPAGAMPGMDHKNMPGMKH